LLLKDKMNTGKKKQKNILWRLSSAIYAEWDGEK
jgi:hypothetical protein